MPRSRAIGAPDESPNDRSLLLTRTDFPAIEVACTPLVVRALQRVGIYSACATARHRTRRALRLTPDLRYRGMVQTWRDEPLEWRPPLAAGPQLWSDHHDS